MPWPPSPILFGYFHRFIIHRPPRCHFFDIPNATITSFVPHIPTYCSRTRVYFHTHGQTRFFLFADSVDTLLPTASSYLLVLLMLRNSCSIPIDQSVVSSSLVVILRLSCPVVSIPCIFMFLRLEPQRGALYLCNVYGSTCASMH